MVSGSSTGVPPNNSLALPASNCVLSAWMTLLHRSRSSPRGARLLKRFSSLSRLFLMVLGSMLYASCKTSAVKHATHVLLLEPETWVMHGTRGMGSCAVQAVNRGAWDL